MRWRPICCYFIRILNMFWMILSRIPIDRRYWKSFVTKSMKHIYWMKIYWKEDSCTKISLLFIDNNEKKVPNWSRGGHNMYYWLFLQAVRYNTVLNPISRMGGPLRENWKRSQISWLFLIHNIRIFSINDGKIHSFKIMTYKFITYPPQINVIISYVEEIN